MFAVIRLLPLILWLALIAGCDDDGGGSTVQSRLESAVASGAASFDFAADQAFVWDRMFVFGCYSSQAVVEKTLGFNWPDYRKTSIESSDSVVLVVFVNGNKVVYWYEQPRSVELGYLDNGKGYLRTEAKFAITRNDGRPELKPIASIPAPATVRTK